jgi:hypothetical protein
MSLLRESAVDVAGATRLEVTPVIRTDTVELKAPPTTVEEVPGAVSVTIGVGKYGELAFTGDLLLVPGPNMLISINGTLYEIGMSPHV